jgi:PTH2 family peptidyl-tRNA hydrolase
MRTKQVILIRKDLKMRRGKEIAQGSHASMEFLVSRLRNNDLPAGIHELKLSPEEDSWIKQGMAKVCLRVESEQELLEYHEQALDSGLQSFLIKDSGRTEFGGIPTYTACAIGPGLVDKIDTVTGNLVLY